MRAAFSPVASKSMIVPSPSVAATCAPSGLKVADPNQAVFGASCRTSLPVAGSQSLSGEWTPAEARSFPSGLNATAMTAPDRAGSSAAPPADEWIQITPGIMNLASCRRRMRTS